MSVNEFLNACKNSAVRARALVLQISLLSSEDRAFLISEFDLHRREVIRLARENPGNERMARRVFALNFPRKVLKAADAVAQYREEQSKKG